MAQEKRRDDRQNREERDSEFVDKLVAINRVAKVVKGGRRFGFAALVVVGDQKGRDGFGHGKAREGPDAMRKATEAAKRDLIFVPRRDGRTLHHDVNGRPRLSVHRSSKNIYAQIIDDVAGKTLASASTLDGDLKALKTGADSAAAAAVGKLVAERAVKAGEKDVVFDRGAFIYHGRVKALAEAAREGGLNF